MANQCFQHLAGPHPNISLPDGVRVYAVGDIHGRKDLLDSLNAKIVADSADAPGITSAIVYLGDYVDRGPASADVIDTLATVRPGGFETVCLMGNHDYFMAAFLDGSGDLDHWLVNGGDDTLDSYGVADWENQGDARQALLDAMPPHHLEFLRTLKLSHRIGGLVFAHAGIDPAKAPDDQTARDLMWIRDPFLTWPEPMDVVVVHGHTPRPTPEVEHHRVGVDTLAWKSGTLTAAVLENGSVRFLST